jgi:hypothetical protein
MKYLLLSLFLISFLSQQATGQKTAKITGKVFDEENNPLIAATVVLLNLPDSTFSSYGLTNDAGKFQISAKRDSTYLLQISYLGYAVYSKNITLEVDTLWGIVVLKEANALLDGVEVVAEHIPVQMKGDTLSFNSAAFHVQTHDDVESLLKQLPGLEIDPNGVITMNGKKVTEVLVDGKTFFGDNAQAALKNLSADAIKKIDITSTKKNKQGIETTEDEKTINLKLKESAKTGVIGSVKLGYGYTIPPRSDSSKSLPSELENHRYRGGVTINYFNPKFRATVFGNINNVNESGGLNTTGNINGAASNLRPGIIRTIMVGTNLNVFLSKKIDLGFTYYYNNGLTTIEQKNFRESVLSNNLYTRNSTENNLSYPQRHFVYGSMKCKIDSTQKLNFRFRINYQTGGSLRNKYEATNGSNDSLENEVNQVYESSQNRLSITPSLNYQKNFKKKGRELVANIVAEILFNNDNSENNSWTNLYNDSGVLTSIDTLQQEQIRTGSNQNYRADITFREPIGKDNKLYFKLEAGIKNDRNEQSAYDILGQQRIGNLNFTDAYWRHYNYQEFNITFKRKVDAYSLSVGLGIKRSALEGVVASSINPIVQAFYFPTGNLQFRYYISKSKKITLTYKTRFSEPRLQQLQPVGNNQNPLSLVIGNPNLQPEYHHNIRLRMDWWEQLTFTNFYTTANLNITQNTIIQSQTFDANFRAIYEPKNDSGLTYRAGLYLGCNTILKKLQLKIDIRGGVSLNQRPILLNGALTRQLNHDYNANLTLSNKKKKIVDMLFTARLVIGNAVYPGNSDLNVSYVNHNYGAKLRVTIDKKWNLSTNFEYKIYANTGYGKAIAVPIWTAGIYRTFLKNNALKVELMGENLLNEAMQINRYNQDGIISQTESVLLGRYIMLKLRYKIKS